MIKEAISKAMNKENLTREEALQVMKEISHRWQHFW